MKDSIMLAKKYGKVFRTLSIVFIVISIISLILQLFKQIGEAGISNLDLEFYLGLLSYIGLIVVWIFYYLLSGKLISFVDAISNGSIFNDEAIKILDSCGNLITVTFIISAILMLSLRVDLIVIGIVLLIFREVFVYGQKIEEENSKTI